MARRHRRRDAREKAIKKWRRAWKVELIEKQNPDWVDLYGTSHL
jgi:putative endonuclease